MSRNPYYLATMPFILVLILYSIHWGNVLPVLTNQLTWFVVIFIITLIVIGFFFKLTCIKKIQYEGNLESLDVNLHLKVSIVLILTVIEGIYFKGFPIMGSVSYSEFGIPFFHPLILTFNSYVLVDALYSLGCKYSILKKIHGILPIILLIVPYIVEVNRGMLVMVGIAGLLAFIAGGNIKISFKIFVKLILAGVAGIYIFGLAGNYRTNFAFTGSSRFFNSFYIMSLGEAESTNIPNIFTPFYWAYIYLSSSLGNLQSTISQLSLNSSMLSPVKFFILQFFPDFISKRIYSQQLDTSQTRINPQFTTGSVFNDAYYLYSWAGIILTVLAILILPVILHFILKNSDNREYVVGFSFLGSMYIFLAFDNMLSFTGLSLPIIYVIISSIISKHRRLK